MGRIFIGECNGGTGQMRHFYGTVHRAALRIMLIVAVLVASFSALVGTTAAADPLIAQTPVAKPQPRIGSTDPKATVMLAVALKPADDRALNDFLAQLANPQSPQYRKFLTPQQFTDRFFTRADRTQVADFLKGKGLTVTDRGLGTLISASGSVADVERAFNVRFSDYYEAGGRVFHAADRTPALPSSIAAKIEGVAGLDDSGKVTSRAIKKPLPSPTAPAPRTQNPRTATGCPEAVHTATRYLGYAPNQLATAYNFNALSAGNMRGEGESVALFELDDFEDANVAAYQSCFGATVGVQRVLVDGGAILGQQRGQDEVELDIDIIVGMAPKLAHLYVYSSPGSPISTEILRQYQQIANDNLASVVSTSWGFCELDVNSYFRNAENTIFRQMAAQGQTFFNALGDAGSQTCVPTSGNTEIVADDIGSQPYVTGVGGTTLSLSATDTISHETVWNNVSLLSSFSRGATGGGISRFWNRPEWQSGPGVTNSYSTGKRQSPDVAANADPQTGYLFYTTDSTNCPTYTGTLGAMHCYEIIGGTSAGAPLWAAATALTNQYLVANNAPRLGFANPVIYGLFRAQPTLFHDVTEGDNCMSAVCVAPGGTPSDGRGTYPATPGYDMTTGVGTLDATRFAHAVLGSSPVLTAIDVTAGPTTGNTPVTLTGTGFQQGMTVSFGGTTATYTLVSATKIIVVSPAHIAAEVQITVTFSGITATAPHTFAYVDPKAAPHATAPVPRPHAVDAPTPTPTPAIPVQAAAATNVPVATSGADPGALPTHPAAPTVAATPNPAPARR